MREKVYRAIPAVLLTAFLAFIFFATVTPDRAVVPLLAYSVAATAALIWIALGRIH